MIVELDEWSSTRRMSRPRPSRARRPSERTAADDRTTNETSGSPSDAVAGEQLEREREQDDARPVVHEALHLDHRREPRGHRHVAERREDRGRIGRRDHRPDDERLARGEDRRRGQDDRDDAGHDDDAGDPEQEEPRRGRAQDLEVGPEGALEDEAGQDDREEELRADREGRRQPDRRRDEADPEADDHEDHRRGERPPRVRRATATEAASSATRSHSGASVASSLIARSSVRRARLAARPSPLGACLPDVDALDDAEPDGEADQGRAAVRDERQRDPGDRHEPDDHPEVHERAGTGSSRRGRSRTSSRTGPSSASRRRAAARRAPRRG